MSEDIGEKISIINPTTRKRQEDLGISQDSRNEHHASSIIKHWKNKDSKKQFPENESERQRKIGKTDLNSLILEYLENEKYIELMRNLRHWTKDFLKQFKRMPKKIRNWFTNNLTFIYYYGLKSEIEKKRLEIYLSKVVTNIKQKAQFRRLI